jgi:hypothetical protein
MKRIFVLVSALCLLGGAVTSADGAVTVMTRNLYLGADLTPVATAQTPEAFFASAQTALAQIAANNFPERAQALAAEIVEKRPHLVGLQEVYNFTINGFNAAPPFRNHLTDLMDALTAQGADYRVAAVVQEFNVAVPLGGNSVGVTDRDVILARGDVPTSVVPVALSGCRQSFDGCNYQVVVRAVLPVGPIAIERGFVAVDALTEDGPLRFVNTHIEDRNLGPFSLLAVQAAQAFELISILAGLPVPPGAETIVVGDINSSPQDQVVVPFIPPYAQLAAAYTDTWTLRPGDPPGFTCCQAEDLFNLDSVLNDRVDVTFTSGTPVGLVKVNLVGNDEADKTPSGLWPSDHAGVVTRMEFAP